MYRLHRLHGLHRLHRLHKFSTISLKAAKYIKHEFHVSPHVMGSTDTPIISHITALRVLLVLARYSPYESIWSRNYTTPNHWSTSVPAAVYPSHASVGYLIPNYQKNSAETW